MKKSSVLLASVLVWASIGSALSRGDDDKPVPPEILTKTHKIAPATGIKAILVALTDDDTLKNGATANLEVMEMLVRALPNFKPETDLIVLKGKDATTAKLMKALEDISTKMNETEALFVYYAGHGAFNKDGHIFQMADGNVHRKDVFRAMPFFAKLRVLITDTCNVPTKGTYWSESMRNSLYSDVAAINPPKKGMGNKREDETDEEYRKRIEDEHAPIAYAPFVLPKRTPEGLQNLKYVAVPKFDYLLRMHDGIVDVSGTSSLEYGWYSGDGGWFTIGFMQALGEDGIVNRYGQGLGLGKALGSVLGDKTPGRLDTPQNPDERHWARFLKRVEWRTSDVFATRKRMILESAKSKDKDSDEDIKKLKEQPEQRSAIIQLRSEYSEK